MSNFFTSFFTSSGIKRRLAAILTSIVNIAYLALPVAPQVQPVIDFLNAAIQAFGGVAVAHAATSGTLSTAKVATLSSLIGTIFLLASIFHIGLPVGIAAALTKLQVILAGISTGQSLSDGKPFQA